MRQELLHETPEIHLQESLDGAENSYSRFYVRVPLRADHVIGLLRQKGVEAIHLSHGDGRCQERLDRNPLFTEYIKMQELPNYAQLHDNVIALPLHASIGSAEAHEIAQALGSSLRAVANKQFAKVANCARCPEYRCSMSLLSGY
jgi:dTDP-4-amino-4,6-dideoxygalactose transaminase